MTPEQLAAIRARLDAAMPGPWKQEKDNNGLAVEVTAFDPDEPDEPWGVAVAYRCCGHGKDRCEDNAALIAHAPADLADLLAYVEQLEGLLRDLCEDSRAAAEVVRLWKVVDHALRYTRIHAKHSAQCSVLVRDIETLLDQEGTR